MTPQTETKQTSENSPYDFSEIMELTEEEKRELLKMWQEVHK